MMDIMKNNKTFIPNVRCTLLGHYQEENIVTTMQIIEELIKLGFDIRKNHIIKGLNDVVRVTGLLGRWQILGRSPLIIADTGHNEDGFKAITRQLEHINYHTLHFVIGMVNDKDTPKLMSLLPETARYYFCKADIPRGLSADELASQGEKHGCKGAIYDSVVQAYQSAIFNAKEKDVVFVGGSTFVVAEVLDSL
jgi:dihydrofolate synthase/folylpolyglutamate synthase